MAALRAGARRRVLRVEHVAALLGLISAATVSGCDDRDLLSHRRVKAGKGEFITRTRGVRGLKKTPKHLQYTEPPIGGGGTARLLVQPIDQRLTRGRFVRAYYLNETDQVGRVWSALGQATPAPNRACEPHWRIDLRYGGDHRELLLNRSCELLRVGDKSFALTGEIAKLLQRFISRASRAPTHKILRIRVPVEHDPKPILAALARHTVEAYLPRRPPRRGPFVRVTLTVSTPQPQDLTALDRAARALRRRGREQLAAYGRAVRMSRPEVVNVVGPQMVFERFVAPRFQAKYAITVEFKRDTPKYMLGFLGLGPGFQVEQATFPKHYRIDAVFAHSLPYRKMRQAIASIKLKPRLSPW